MDFSKLFITGCDKNTEWMLPWFINNYYEHNDTPLRVMDFGMSDVMAKRFENRIIDHKVNIHGWFKKPTAMIKACKLSLQVCWLDTDCEVRGDISDIFNHIIPNKLAMGEDAPWTARRGERWHNSGVVAFERCPTILTHWAGHTAVMLEDKGPMYGDQDILHELVTPGLNREIHITTLPKKYNTLRLDLIDNTAPQDIKIMHWTGRSGKDEIRKQMNE